MRVSKSRVYPAASWLAFAGCAAAAALIFIRAFRAPISSSVGLGGSWEAALSEAGARGLVFGRDIVFTYGPLGFLATGSGSPAKYGQELGFGIIVAALLAALVVYATSETGWYVPKVVFVVAVLVCLSDAGLVEIATIILMIAWTLPQFRAKRGAPLAALLLGLISGLGLLVKFNLGFAACASGLVLFGLRASRTQTRSLEDDDLKSLLTFVLGAIAGSASLFAQTSYGTIAAALLLVILIVAGTLMARARGRTAVLLASAAGLAALVLVVAPSYRAFIAGSWQVASGYSSAMALNGNAFELPFALAIYLLVGLMLFANRARLTVPVAAALLVTLFFGYKEGFVRQDLHVASAFWTPLVICAIVVRFSSDRRSFVLNVACTLIAAFALQTVLNFEKAPDVYRVANGVLPSIYESDISDFVAAWQSDETTAATYTNGLAPDRLPEAVVKEIGPSTVDVEPLETAVVFGNGFNWNPTPVFQSYSAYTPSLDDLDARHIREAGADYVLFKWFTIDGRQVSWDQPREMRAIICGYRLDSKVAQPAVVSDKDEFLVLRHSGDRCGLGTQLGSAAYSWGDKIPVGDSKGLLFLSLRVHYSLIGQILKIIFRAPEVWAVVTDAQGGLSQYRIVTETSADGILVSPFPQDLSQFRALLENHTRPPSVRSVQLQTDGAFFFQNSVQASFEAVPYR